MKKLLFLVIAVTGMQTYLKAVCEKEYELSLKEGQEMWKNPQNHPYFSCEKMCYKEEKTYEMVMSCTQKCGEKYMPAYSNFENCGILDGMRSAQETKK